jgi:hypothetical protein
MAFSTEISGIVCLLSDLNVSDLSVALLPKPAALSECLYVNTVSACDRHVWDVPSLDRPTWQKKSAKALDEQ